MFVLKESSCAKDMSKPRVQFVSLNTSESNGVDDLFVIMYKISCRKTVREYNPVQSDKNLFLNVSFMIYQGEIISGRNYLVPFILHWIFPRGRGFCFNSLYVCWQSLHRGLPAITSLTLRGRLREKMGFYMSAAGRVEAREQGHQSLLYTPPHCLTHG